MSDRIARPLGERRSPLPSTRVAVRDAGTRVDVRVAVVVWLCAWLVGQLGSAAIVTAAGAEDADALSIPTLGLAVSVTWVAYLAGMWAASDRVGSGSFVDDYGVRFRRIDLVGVPIGVLTQLVLAPLVYLPLRSVWPDTFSDDRLRETARDLTDRASGASVVLLVMIVAIGAPIVEELVYRGLLQGSFSARVNGTVAWIVASLWFALVHFRPVEYPGLLVFALVVGACALVTRRLGMSIAAHIAFNATGLVLAFG